MSNRTTALVTAGVMRHAEEWLIGDSPQPPEVTISIFDYR